jgi:NAD(P)-dependent dehydrogenase (short-subunit alcohol dehydrogenase family)
MFDLSGKRAVVTGASSGIGQAIAIALASAGADVASIYVDNPEGAEVTRRAVADAGRSAIMVQGDVGVSAEVASFGGRIRAEWGGLDIWVNNAARTLVRDFSAMTIDEWHSVLRTNLHGYFYGCREAVLAMRPRGRGRIINVSSATDVQPISGMTAYITAKGGVVALTKSLALELGPAGITVNAVAPGAVDTALNTEVYTPAVRRAYGERIAVGRIARPADIASAVVYLSSDEACYVTGHELLVDGGLVLNGNMGFKETGGLQDVEDKG